MHRKAGGGGVYCQALWTAARGPSGAQSMQEAGFGEQEVGKAPVILIPAPLMQRIPAILLL